MGESTQIQNSRRELSTLQTSLLVAGTSGLALALMGSLKAITASSDHLYNKTIQILADYFSQLYPRL